MVRARDDHERACVRDHLLDDGGARRAVGVVEAALHHAASVAVHRDGEALALHQLEDEGGALLAHHGEHPLDDVVAVHVAHLVRVRVRVRVRARVRVRVRVSVRVRVTARVRGKARG